MKISKNVAALTCILAIGLFLLSFGSTPAAAQHHGHVEAASDSVQIVEITIGPDGFQPNEIALEAHTPARLVFTRTTDETCATQVKIPAFGIEKTDLSLGEPVAIEIMPHEAGTFTFVCGMDMLEGTIIVASSGSHTGHH